MAKRRFKRGILRDLELINAEGEAGGEGRGGRLGNRVAKRGFKRGILRHPELINAEGEGGEGGGGSREEERMSGGHPVWPRGPGTMFLRVVEWAGSQPIGCRSFQPLVCHKVYGKCDFGFSVMAF